jgi:hypothetical protein
VSDGVSDDSYLDSTCLASFDLIPVGLDCVQQALAPHLDPAKTGNIVNPQFVASSRLSKRVVTDKYRSVKKPRIRYSFAMLSERYLVLSVPIQNTNLCRSGIGQFQRAPEVVLSTECNPGAFEEPCQTSPFIPYHAPLLLLAA